MQKFDELDVTEVVVSRNCILQPKALLICIWEHEECKIGRRQYLYVFNHRLDTWFISSYI